jgi:hypothetical protein
VPGCWESRVTPAASWGVGAKRSRVSMTFSKYVAEVGIIVLECFVIEDQAHFAPLGNDRQADI